MTEAEKVEVTQAEIEAAADYWRSKAYHKGVQTSALPGGFFWCELLEAVNSARHHLAHTAGDVEPVAYRHRVTDYQGNPLPGWAYCDDDLSNPLSLPREYLYAHPPAPIDAEAMPPWYCQLPDAVHAEVVKHVREIQSFTVGFSDQQIGVMAEAVYNALVDARALPLPKAKAEGDEG